MRRESFQGILLGIVIMCAVFAFITIAWATFNSTLTINGTAKVSKQSWDIDFTNEIDVKFGDIASGNPLTGSLTGGHPTAGTLTLGGQGLTASNGSNENIGTLMQSGDEITYTWYIQNFGTFDADLTFTGVRSAVTTSSDSGNSDNIGNNVNLTCTYDGSGGSSYTTDINTFCTKYMSAKLTISDADGSNPVVVTTATSAISLPAATSTTNDNTDVKMVKLVIKMTTDQGTGSGSVDVVSAHNLNVALPTISINAVQHTTS